MQPKGEQEFMVARPYAATPLPEQRVRAAQEELARRIARAITTDGHDEPLPGVHLYRHSIPLEQVHSVIEPSFCVVAQGSKEFLLGESRYRYDPAHYLLSTIDLPSVGQVIEASAEQPFLSLRLVLDPTVVSAVMLEAGQVMVASLTKVRAVAVNAVDVDLLDATVRLMRLLDTPTAAPVLLPLVKREIVVRLLMSDQGTRLRHLTFHGGDASRMICAIERLRQDLDQPLRVEQLAHELGMSVSGLHHHFKAVTGLSPLQYQKRLRLLEARRLMLNDRCDATRAAFRVGYTNTSHFNREYKSLFGAPPLRDVRRLRAPAAS